MPPRKPNIIYDDDEPESEDGGSDMQLSQSEGDGEDQLDMDNDDEADEAQADEADELDVVGEVIDDKDVEEVEEEELLEDDEVEPPEESEPVAPPRLKIKLKFSQANHPPVVTPEGQTSRDIDVESEDEDDDDDDRSTTTAGASGRALTARQAVLRNVVDSSHVSLAEAPNPRKKKPLTELEIALKREETARKRRNLTEKKLEDEKTETINRLLKKQSRPRGKRSALATAEDRSVVNNGSADGDGEEGGEPGEAPVLVIPTMYRWNSTSRPQGKDGDGPALALSFSVPISVLPPKPEDGSDAMDVDPVATQPATPSPVQTTPPVCDIQGCTARRKYRLVRNMQMGACGMEHLKALGAQVV